MGHAKASENGFLLPRQENFTARRRKNFSLGREQMQTPRPPLGGE